MKFMHLTLLGLMGILTNSAYADVLEQRCLQLEKDCLYVALQQRDKAKIIHLLAEYPATQVQKKPEILDQLLAQVPLTDPISVEVPMDMEKFKSKNEQQMERMYFYIYPDHAVRMRIIYDSLKPDAKVTGFWLMKIDPNQAISEQK